MEEKRKRIKKVPPTLKVDMRNIRPQGTGFRVEVMINGQKKGGTAVTLEDALRLRGQLRAELQGGTGSPTATPTRAAGWTLKDGIEKTFKLYWTGSADEYMQRIRCRHLLEFFGPKCTLREITSSRIVEFREWAEAALKNGPNTVNKKVMTLSKILHTAHDMGQLPVIPRIHRARIQNGRLRVFNQEEERQLSEGFKYLTTPAHHDALLVLLDTGFRLGELWTLTAASINIFAGIVTLQAPDTKNKEARSVPMTARGREILTRRAQEYPEGPLWPKGKNCWFQYQWERVRSSLGKTGDPEWVPHSLRHTYITRMVIATGDVFLVQRLAGHKTLAMTQRYTHHAPQHFTEAAKKLEAFTRGNLDDIQAQALKIS